MHVKQIMSHEFIRLTTEATIKQAIEQFLEKKQDIACIFDLDYFVGIITKNSIYRLLLETNQLNTVIRPAIIKNIVSVNSDENVYKAKDQLLHHKIAHSIVMNNNNEVVGVLSRADVVHSLIAEADHLSRKLQLLMNSLSSGIISVDLDGQITAINKSAHTFIGQDHFKKLIGKNVHEVVPGLKTLLDDAIKKGEILEINRIGMGNTLVLCSIIPIKDWKQKIGAMIVLEDVTKFEKISKDLEIVRLSHTSESFSHIISVNPFIQKLKEEAYIAAKGFSTILITGPSGTGKELLANGIHHASKRKGSFIKVNCSAIPEALMESEFFGYEDGAFTGAKKGGKPGKFDIAKGGTLFLDEIGEMPLSLQVKLLRVLQEREYEKVGGITTYKADVRILAATNQNLLYLVHTGKFREDLYYRLNVIQLEIPPLEKRKEDIPILCNHFIRKFQRYNPKGIIGVTKKAVRKLQGYTWPGNIRELENVLERAYQFCNENWIEDYFIQIVNQAAFDYATTNIEEDRPKKLTRKEKLQVVDKDAIIEALANAKGNKSEAALALGISRSNLYQKINKYQIQLSYR